MYLRLRLLDITVVLALAVVNQAAVLPDQAVATCTQPIPVISSHWSASTATPTPTSSDVVDDSSAIHASTSVLPATTVLSSSPSVTSDACYVTAYSAIPAATAACTSITLDGITVPGNSTIDLSKLKTGTKVTFKGTTFWEYFDANYPFIKVGGADLEITATDGAVLDGNGQSWWDGLGSNGGLAK